VILSSNLVFLRLIQRTSWKVFVWLQYKSQFRLVIKKRSLYWEK